MSLHIEHKNKHHIHERRLHSVSPKAEPSAPAYKEMNAGKKTIVLYSPDLDFCVSLQLLFQNLYNIITTTELDMMMTMVRSMQPELVIVDSLPTERMQQRFQRMRNEDPGVRIMVFYASSLESSVRHEAIRQTVDAAFSKPIDLTEVMKRVNDFTLSVN